MGRRNRLLWSWATVFALLGAALWAGPLPSASAAPGGTGGTGVVSISAGQYHTCAVRGDGSAVCWGANYAGESSAPSGTFTSVSAGNFASCGLRPDGSVTCWGDGAGGLLNVPSDTFTSVGVGYQFACGLRPDGRAVCWGAGSPPSDSQATDTFASLSVGNSHVCGVRADGTADCWGENGSGQIDVPAGTYSSVVAGGAHTCGLRTDGSAVCWGLNDKGQATAPAGLFVGLTVGLSYACGLRSDSTLTCWGQNGGMPAVAPAGTFSALAPSRLGHSCAVRTNGAAVCWGYDNLGQLGVAPAVPAPAPPSATLGVPYRHTFTSTTGTPAGTFAVTAGVLPAGLTLSPAGVLSGTPSGGAGRSSFTVTASNGVFEAGSADLTIVVDPPPDSTAPTTTIALSPSTPTGANGWYTGPVTATVSATDPATGSGGTSPSGVATTRCSVDQNPAPATFADLPSGCAYTTATPVTGQGSHTVYAASMDEAGNTEALRSTTFRIDGVAPTLAPTFSTSRILLRQTGVTASPGATDVTSGLASQACGPVDTSTAGDHTLTCQATDRAGNQTTTQVHYTVEYQILDFISPQPGTRLTAGQAVQVKVALADATGTVIPDSEAFAVAGSSPCRATFRASGSQTAAPQCLVSNPATNQFFTVWKSAKTPGAVTLTVSVTYPGTITTTTRSTTVTLNR